MGLTRRQPCEPSFIVALLTFATLFALTATAAAQGSEKTKVDVTGSWALEVQTDAGGTTTPSVTLKQDGEKLTAVQQLFVQHGKPHSPNARNASSFFQSSPSLFIFYSNFAAIHRD